MRHRLRARARNTDGFTLIELLVVVIILGILAAIAVPVFLSQRTRGTDAQAKADLRNIANEQDALLAGNGHYATLTEVEADGFRPSAQSGAATATVLWRDESKTPTTVEADASGGYVICATTKNGNVWVYDSLAGGLQASGTACPSA